MTTSSRPDESPVAVTTTYGVEGMTCGHCVSAVIEELGALDGVSTVRVELAPGGTSRVTVAGTRPLTEGQVAAALDEAGDYRLAGTAG
jgi:copper chaperone